VTYGGQRRTLVNNYYQAVNWSSPSDCEKVLKVFEDVLNALETKDIWGEISYTNKELLSSLSKVLTREGYPYENGKIIRKEAINNIEDIQNATDILDPAHFSDYTTRIRKSIIDDPSLAVGSTKELIEAVLKTILGKLEVTYDKNDDIPKLLKAVQTNLNLLPKEISDEMKGAEIIKALLSNLGQVVIRLAELRNLYGTGHGKESTNRGIQPRHARLAVNSGIALATFLLETFSYTVSKN
jgi:hypothetical protein